jgi:hypothetical protein
MYPGTTASRLPIVAVISGPNSVGACDSVILDGSVMSGNVPAGATFEWHQMHPTSNAITTAGAASGVVTISTSALAIGTTYTYKLIISAKGQPSSNAAFHSFQYQPSSGPSHLTIRTSPLASATQATVEVVQASCIPGVAINDAVSWELKVDGEVVDLAQFNVRTTTSKVMLPVGVFGKGSSAELIATVGSGTTTTGKMRIAKSVPDVVVVGPANQLFPISETFELDASSSLDPAGGALTFKWSCSQEDANRLPIPCAYIGDNSTIGFTNAKLTVPRNIMSAQKCTWTVNVTSADGGASSLESVVVTYTADTTTPYVEVKETPARIVLNEGKVVLSAKARWPDGGASKVAQTWSEVTGSGLDLTDETIANDDKTGTLALTVAPNTFTKDHVYIFRVTTGTSYADFEVEVNTPPQGGSCTASPDAASGNVVVSCTGFTDRSQLLTYDVGYVLDTDPDSTPVSIGRGPKRTMVVMPPPVLVRLVVTVSDRDGAAVDYQIGGTYKGTAGSDSLMGAAGCPSAVEVQAMVNDASLKASDRLYQDATQELTMVALLMSTCTEPTSEHDDVRAAALTVVSKINTEAVLGTDVELASAAVLLETLSRGQTLNPAGSSALLTALDALVQAEVAAERVTTRTVNNTMQTCSHAMQQELTCEELQATAKSVSSLASLLGSRDSFKVTTASFDVLGTQYTSVDDIRLLQGRDGVVAELSGRDELPSYCSGKPSSITWADLSTLVTYPSGVYATCQGSKYKIGAPVASLTVWRYCGKALVPNPDAKAVIVMANRAEDPFLSAATCQFYNTTELTWSTTGVKSSVVVSPALTSALADADTSADGLVDTLKRLNINTGEAKIGGVDVDEISKLGGDPNAAAEMKEKKDLDGALSEAPLKRRLLAEAKVTAGGKDSFMVCQTSHLTDFAVLDDAGDFLKVGVGGEDPTAMSADEISANRGTDDIASLGVVTIYSLVLTIGSGFAWSKVFRATGNEHFLVTSWLGFIFLYSSARFVGSLLMMAVLFEFVQLSTWTLSDIVLITYIPEVLLLAVFTSIVLIWRVLLLLASSHGDPAAMSRTDLEKAPRKFWFSVCAVLMLVLFGGSGYALYLDAENDMKLAVFQMTVIAISLVSIAIAIKISVVAWHRMRPLPQDNLVVAHCKPLFRGTVSFSTLVGVGNLVGVLMALDPKTIFTMLPVFLSAQWLTELTAVAATAYIFRRFVFAAAAMPSSRGRSNSGSSIASQERDIVTPLNGYRDKAAVEEAAEPVKANVHYGMPLAAVLFAGKDKQLVPTPAAVDRDFSSRRGSFNAWSASDKSGKASPSSSKKPTKLAKLGQSTRASVSNLGVTVEDSEV